MNLYEQIDDVKSRDDLGRFVGQLRADLSVNGHLWESTELGPYLEALEAFIHDLPGYFENRGELVSDQPDWGLIAVMLLAAKHYE